MKLAKMNWIAALLPLSVPLILTHCAHPKTFGEQLKGEGPRVADLSKSWQKGDAMIAEGNQLLKTGEPLLKKGQQDVTKGQGLIAAGEKLKGDAEAEYKARSSTPYAEG